MKKTNGQEGITLIALVVTIVVLLILAGVTIVYVMSDGGIFGTASKAAEDTKVGAILDYVGNAQSQIMMANYTTVTATLNGTETTIGASGDSAKAVSILQSNFPAGAYTVSAGTSTGYANGKFSAGDYKITNAKVATETYTLTFDASGVPTCVKDKAAE